MKFAKIVFRVAGLYGLAVILPLYFWERQIGRTNPPALTHPEYYYGFVGVTLAWQVLFLMLATDPPRYRPLMLPAMIEKVTFVIAVICLFVQHRVSGQTLAFGLIDLLFLALFFAAYLRTATLTSEKES